MRMYRSFSFFLLLIQISRQTRCIHPFKYDEQTKLCDFGDQTKVNYAEALAICHAMPGGTLPSIHSDFQNQMLLEVHVRDSFPVWLGLSRLNPRLREWAWDDLSLTDYSNWAKIDDDNNNVIMMENGKWMTENESALHSVFCFENLDMDRCPDGWTWFNETNACYVVAHDMSFNEGEAYCKEYGGHLASIHSAAENDFIYDLAYYPCGLSGGDAHEVLLGAVWDYKAEQIRRWTDGSPVDYMGKICMKQPNSIIQLAADEDGCGFCAGHTWLPGGHSVDTRINRIVCKTRKRVTLHAD